MAASPTAFMVGLDAWVEPRHMISLRSCKAWVGLNMMSDRGSIPSESDILDCVL